MFKTLREIEVRDNPSFAANLVGKVGANIDINVTGSPVEKESWIWHNVEGGDNLWIPERTVDGKQIWLSWAGLGTPPRPAETIAFKQTVGTIKPLRQLPQNVDIDSADYERTYRASLAITRGFEGGGFDSYNNYDKGIVSYGIMQFTLGSGSLGRVIDKYLNACTSETATCLKSEFSTLIKGKDQSLRENNRFKELLKAAAKEKEMQQAQFDCAENDYWNVVLENYIQRRGNLKLPLTYALLFDMGINFGVNHSFVRRAEESLGVPSNSRPGDNGITEQQLIKKVAQLRKESHYAQADRDNLPGLKPRGDFWVNLTEQGDWYLQGDKDGFVYPKKGVKVQVKNPF